MIKKEGTVDLRIKRTQRAIKNSFFQLVDEKGFDHISVKDITDTAMISRNTFYLHYSDKYDLLNKICDELLSSLFTKASKQFQQIENEKFSIESIASVVEHSVNCIGENKKAFCILFNSSSADVLTNKLIKGVTRGLEYFISDIDTIDDLSVQYIISGMIGVIKYYATNDVTDIKEKCIELSRINFSTIIDSANKRKITV